MDVIPDTNIVVSLFLTDNHTATLIKRALDDERFTMVISRLLLVEYREVLARPRLEPGRRLDLFVSPTQATSS